MGICSSRVELEYMPDDVTTTARQWRNVTRDSATKAMIRDQIVPHVFLLPFPGNNDV